VVLRVNFRMSSKRVSVNPLALILKPQSPAERMAAQDREKPQRERPASEHCTASASASATASATASASSTNSSSSAQASLGSRTQK